MQAENESKGKDTHRQIVEVAERLFRQIGFQKTSVERRSRREQRSHCVALRKRRAAGFGPVRLLTGRSGRRGDVRIR
jgi:hypothetical protein